MKTKAIKRNRIRTCYSWCNSCGKKAELTKYRKKYLCGECLTQGTPAEYADDNHPLVRSNYRSY